MINRLKSLLNHNKTPAFAHLIIAGWSAILAFIPLFNVLGYEFALAMNAALIPTACYLGVSISQQFGRKQDAAFLVTTRRVLVHALSLTIAPLVIISVNTLRVPTCAYLQGIAFFLLIPTISSLIAATTGLIAGRLFQTRRSALTMAFFTIGFSLLWVGYRVYTGPSIAIYDPFIGYFSGALYDDSVTISPALLWARLYHLAMYFSAIGVVALFYYRSLGSFLLVGALIGVSTTIACYQSALGFNVDHNHLLEQLGGARTTKHFRIIFPREWSKEKVQQVAEDHEFRYEELARSFKSRPPQIRSYIFRSSAEKRRLIGSGRVLFAKPWQRAIFLEASSFPYPLLKHELVHVFAADFGDPLLGISLSWWPPGRVFPLPRIAPGLIEGLAVALDWAPRDDQLGHERAAALLRLDKAPEIETLLGVGFLRAASSRAYVYAGSFVRFLIDRYGMRKILTTYQLAGNYKEVYGKSLSGIIDEWRSFLKSVPLPAEKIALARESFRRPSIFRRSCPHEVARLKAEARIHAKAQRFLEISTLLAKICRLAPNDPAHQIARFEGLILAGNLQAAMTAARSLLQKNALNVSLRRIIYERIGDLHWMRGERTKADTFYSRADKLPAHSDGSRRLDLKRWALTLIENDDHEEPHAQILRETIRQYLIPDPREKNSLLLKMYRAQRIEQLSPTSGIGAYLVARLLVNAGHMADAIPLLLRAEQGTLISGSFRQETKRLLARAFYLTRNYEASAAAFRTLRTLGDTSDGTKARIDVWLERIRWAKKQGV